MLKISEKLRPFSHEPGTAVLVPGSDWIVRAYPVLLRVGGEDFPLQITGPVREFTLQLDLERDCLWVWGIAKEGHFRYKLFASEQGLFLSLDRSPKSGFAIGNHSLKPKETILLQSGGQFISPSKPERFSLGNSKAQDWDLVRRRNNIFEWAPVLYALAQKVPNKGDVTGGPLALLNRLEEFFPAAFEGILVPHLTDPLHQGLFTEEGRGNALALLREAFQTIRGYILDENRILPALPADWHCGRALHLQSPFGRLDLEWTKGTLRQMVLYGEKTGEATFLFSKPIKSFRFNGERASSQQSLLIESGKKYHLDRFQK